MKASLLIFSVLVLLLSGCFNKYSDIIQKSNNEWDFRECLTVISASVGSNFLDFRTNIKAAVTPYYPSVVFALQRNAQRIMHWSESEFQYNTNELMKLSNGLYIDWKNNKLVDSRGNYYKDYIQIDSLMFLITLINQAWTSINSQMEVICNGMLIAVPLISFDQCYIPDITDIEHRIFLINDKGKFIRPKYVWGRKNNVLTTEETLLVMFNFRNGDYHFLSNSKKMQILIKGFEIDMRFDFPLTMMN